MTDDPQLCDGDRLWALALGVLEPDEALLQEAHVATCGACQAWLGAIRADVDALGCFAGQDQSPHALATAIVERSHQAQARGRRLRWITIGLGLLASVAIGLGIAHRLTERALVRRDLWRLEHAIQRIQNTEGHYPNSEEALAEALRRLPPSDLQLEPRGLPLDRWGQPFRYRYPGTRVSGLFDLWSTGPDGVDDAGGPDDLTNGPR